MNWQKISSPEYKSDFLEVPIIQNIVSLLPLHVYYVPMKYLFYDCFSGISGDMNLGAMVDLGVPEDYLIGELSKLNLDNEFELSFEKTLKMGISGVKAHVKLTDHRHVHRHLADIRKILDESSLSEDVHARSMDMFRRIAEAEAKIHGKNIEEVHFHEVGATDSIVDIVGAAICHDFLKIDKIRCSPIQLGGGFVECAHGTFPVPAPATMEILKDIPCLYGAVDSETTTPTGAAILASVVDEFSTHHEMTVSKVAYGLGRKDFPFPNVLRVMRGEILEADEPHYLREDNLLMECNIDDMIAEDLENLVSQLLAKGAKDVFFTSIIMKKTRPAVKLSVLLHPHDKTSVLAALFAHSSTFGVRTTVVQKMMLPREIQSVETAVGTVRVKIAREADGTVRWKPEYDDIRTISERNQMSHENIRRLVARKMEEIR